MKFLKRFIIIVFCIILNLPAFAITIKVASLAPEGTPWDNRMNALALEWKKISGGTVNIKIYPGGIAGAEEDTIRKVRIGQLQGVILTGMGLKRVSSDLLVMSLPMLFHNNEEIHFILKEMGPVLEAGVKEKGFIIVVWQIAGWVNFFSRDSVVYPEDLMKQKLSVSAGESDLEQAWKVAGFNVVQLDTMEIMSGLQTGMIDAFYTPPIMAAAYQWFAMAPYMCSVKVAPLVGAFLISDKYWNRISEEIKPELLDAAVKIMNPLSEETMELEKKAIEIMQKNGLIYNKIPRDVEAEWADVMTNAYKSLIGKEISSEIFNKTTDLLNNFRNAE